MNARPLIFGEVLFDHFPDGSARLGGAPFNVACHLAALGLAPLLVSAIGDDADGRQIHQAMQQRQMDEAGLQTDPQHPTGRVQVSLHDGEPSYEIVNDCAYDHIQATHLDPAPYQLLYHGSLAQRGATSRQTLHQLRERCGGLIFLDVNLRRPWWQREQVLADMQASDWVKLNQHELAELGLGGASLAAAAKQVLTEFGLQGIIVTAGEQGALTLTADGQQQRIVPQGQQEVVDAVGAGDAFTAVMLAGLLRQRPLAETMAQAQQLASAIVGIRGALPDSPDFYDFLRR